MLAVLPLLAQSATGSSCLYEIIFLFYKTLVGGPNVLISLTSYSRANQHGHLFRCFIDM